MLDQLFSNPVYRRNRSKLLFLFDSIIVGIAYLVAYWAKIDFRFAIVDEVNKASIIYFFLLVIVIYAICFLAFRVYRSLWSYISSKEVIYLCLANALATFIIIGITWLFTQEMFYISVEFIASL